MNKKTIILAITVLNLTSTSLFSMDSDVTSADDNNRTPPQTRIYPLAHSAPARLKDVDNEVTEEDEVVTPVTSKSKSTPLTDPIKSKSRSDEEVYADQKTVSKKFFDQQKRDFVAKRAHILFIDFIQDYIRRQPSRIDITGLSARSRIYLLSSIVNFKISLLPLKAQEWSSHQLFKNWTFPSNGFWQKTPQPVIQDCTDLIPTTFIIGKFEYKLKQGATCYQKGSGRVYGLISSEAAETYAQILNYWNTIPAEKIKAMSGRLLAQKKDGLPIDTGDEVHDRLFNGLNLLFDFEVARRLAPDDKYGDMPIVTFIHFLLENIGNKTVFFGLIDGASASLFKDGEGDRVTHAKNVIPELEHKASKTDIRGSLKYLHQSDEDSEDEYSIE